MDIKGKKWRNPQSYLTLSMTSLKNTPMSKKHKKCKNIKVISNVFLLSPSKQIKSRKYFVLKGKEYVT
jgi:hypothetical protein